LPSISGPGIAVSPGHIATGVCDVGNDSRLDQTARPPKRHDDRDGVRRLPRRKNCRRTDGDDDGHLGIDQFAGEPLKLIEIVIGCT